ncbi:hypothetical protein ASPCAL10857 [Aspergillus calidoustus]|uniref:RING-type domain-containing protein n=1 Tax=Aspergillus calidoustus TaxID=454130 RepID=A0A0U5G7L9_ASPCI|nr:hypothetical protein ASPCAL10857 [Aspergillus calidoustus]
MTHGIAPFSPICLDEIHPDDFVHSLACRHMFHEKCLRYWYLYSNNNCPLCQRSLLFASDVREEGTASV